MAEVTPIKQLADVLARLPEMKERCETRLQRNYYPGIGMDMELIDCISLIEQFHAMLEQARREALVEAFKVAGQLLVQPDTLDRRSYWQGRNEAAEAIRKLAEQEVKS